MSLTEEQVQRLQERLEAIKAEPKPKPGGKRKTYLSRADRAEALVLAAMAGALDDVVAGWEERSRPGASRRAAKLARYWTYQALEEMLQGIDEPSVAALMRDAERAHISVDVK